MLLYGIFPWNSGTMWDLSAGQPKECYGAKSVRLGLADSSSTLLYKTVSSHDVIWGDHKINIQSLYYTV